MLIARAPVRISLAGGGTDLPAYYESFGGVVLNVTIDKYFYVVLNVCEKDNLQISSSDYRTFYRHNNHEPLLWDGDLSLPRAILNHFGIQTGLSIFLASEVPPGTGLGSSSAVTVAIIKAISYRLTDIQCALGLSQLRKLPGWVTRRREIAQRYDAAFADVPTVNPLRVRGDVSHAYHLYVVQLDLDRLRTDRTTVFAALRAEGIGVNVHYIPVHLHPFYQQRFGTRPGLCPVAEAAYGRVLSSPMFASMTDQEVNSSIQSVLKVCNTYQK